MSTRLAVCNCGNPMIYTFAFSGAEYYCLACGNSCGMFDTRKTDATPELTKKLKADEKKFKTVNKYLLSGGVMFNSCEICSKKNEPHILHCSDAEKENHRKAMAKLKRWQMKEGE